MFIKWTYRSNCYTCILQNRIFRLVLVKFISGLNMMDLKMFEAYYITHICEITTSISTRRYRTTFSIVWTDIMTTWTWNDVQLSCRSLLNPVSLKVTIVTCPCTHTAGFSLRTTMKAIAATYGLKMCNIRPENVTDIRLEIFSRPGNI